MRKRVSNWQGQGFVYLGLEGKAGEPLEQQSKALFARAGQELRSFGLSLDKNVVRTRVFGRTRYAQCGKRHARQDFHRVGTRRELELHRAGAFRIGC